MHKITNISLKKVEVVILSEIAVILSVTQLVTTVIFSQLEISYMLNGTTTEIQHRK